jgi:hypothetical protein|tara:strand:- start:719 stop:1012 length:294 start_codon:yes stop_codon:yes gene_type:complete
MTIYITQEECDNMFPSLRDMPETFIPEDACKSNYGPPRISSLPRLEDGITIDMKTYLRAYKQTPKGKTSQKIQDKKLSAKRKAETGFARGYSQAKVT